MWELVGESELWGKSRIRIGEKRGIRLRRMVRDVRRDEWTGEEVDTEKLQVYAKPSASLRFTRLSLLLFSSLLRLNELSIFNQISVIIQKKYTKLFGAT